MKLTPETIDHPRYTSRYFVQGNGFKRLERYLVLKLDGQDVWIQSEQRLLDRYGVVVFTPNPDDPDDEHYLRYTAILPAEKDAQGLAIRATPQEVAGATADPRIVQYFMRFYNDLQTNRWRDGHRL